ncbi:MAG: hypothetical protein IAF08_12985 [Rhizobacter sp.]|nr:hypothetical protein [Chlorobiales bacterium]
MNISEEQTAELNKVSGQLSGQAGHAKPPAESLPAKIAEQFREASQDVMDIVNARIALIKMDLIDIMSRAVVVIIFAALLLVGALFVFIFLAMLIGQALGNSMYGFLIMGTALITVSLLVFRFQLDVSNNFIHGLIDDLIYKDFPEKNN